MKCRHAMLIALLFAGALLGTAPPAVAGDGDTMSVPVTFRVANVNRSALACPSDGVEYELRGDLVGPRSVLADPNRRAAATLYLHEFGFDDFWNFRTVPGYDYAEAMAELGHVTVALDRLGYDDSPHPDGNGICIGSHADMAHQVIEQLRGGSYGAGGISARRFDRVVLAGHSVGGVVAELAAYSFGDADALMFFGHTDSGYSPPVTQRGVEQGSVCLRGGDRESPGDPANYSFFARDEQSLRELAFHDPDPAVLHATFVQRHPDPCGDVTSFVPALGVNNARSGDIEVPVLLAYGRQDAALSPGAGEQQADAYPGSDDVTLAYFERMSHAMTLEPAARQLQAAVAEWLRRRGFASASPVPGAGGRLRGCPRTARVIAGSDSRDVLRGSNAADAVFGLARGDRIDSRDGPDCARGGDGSDRIVTGAGGDRAYGDGGNDKIVGGPGSDRLYGKSGSDRIDAADGRRDLVSCGSGRDRARADAIDRTVGCERVTRR